MNFNIVLQVLLLPSFFFFSTSSYASSFLPFLGQKRRQQLRNVHDQFLQSCLINKSDVSTRAPVAVGTLSTIAILFARICNTIKCQLLGFVYSYILLIIIARLSEQLCMEQTTTVSTGNILRNKCLLPSLRIFQIKHMLFALVEKKKRKKKESMRE